MLPNLLKGIFIGIALVIPGLSASTFAVVTGIYDKIIFAVSNLRSQFKKSLFFLTPIGLGTAAGILASAGLIIRVMEYFPLQSYAFFIGLVVGSVPTIYSKIKPSSKSPLGWTFTAVCFAAVAALSFIVPTDNVVSIYAIESAGDFISIFSAGLIACFLLAVPGISGSLIIILLGQYGTVYGAVSNFSDVIFMALRGRAGALELGLDSGLIILVFAAGSVIGLASAAKIIGWLIERFEISVYFAVMGLVLGAVVTLFVIGAAEHFMELSPYLVLNTVFLAVFGTLGYICTKFIGRNEVKS